MIDIPALDARVRALVAQGRMEEAEALVRPHLASGSGPMPLWRLLAHTIRPQGKLTETRAIQEMLVDSLPGELATRFDLAETALLLGDFDRGWREYHWRYSLDHTTRIERKVQSPRWDGRPIPGQTLLIHDEQGFGDTFQFLRMVSWAKERSQARLILEINPEALSLAKRAKGFDEIVVRGAIPPRFDVHCEMMSLPMVMGLQLSDLPGTVPYLSPDRARLAKWRKRLAKLPRPLVALVWAGRPSHHNDANRSMSLADLAPLALPGVTYLAIQKGPKAEEAKGPPPGMSLVCLSDEITDFEDTAAILAIADLLISVDSSPVHLAGALGRPAWVMLPFVPDWRWLLDRADTPWYPSLRLFRQRRRGEWAPVLDEMAKSLGRLRPNDVGADDPPEIEQAKVPSPIPDSPIVLKECRHGRMLFLWRDIYVGRSLDLYGEFSHLETTLFTQFAQPGMVVIEVGANIGAHTVSLAQMVGPQGIVVALEPQRVIFQLLCANVALNGLFNVRTHQAAAGRKAGTLMVPPLDYAAENNFGGISLGSEAGGESVPVITLDSLALPAVHIIKIDVEGMEADVLAGARQLIARDRPVLYLENDRREKSPALIRLLDKLGYECWWHTLPMFNPDNAAGRRENVFPGILSLNLVCLPNERPLVMDGFHKVAGPDDWPLP